MLTNSLFAALELDGIAIKPSETDISHLSNSPFDQIIIDYEGMDVLPDRREIEELADEKTVHLTTPVRASSFDPIADRGSRMKVPSTINRIFVAGNPKYLTESEQNKTIQPRIVTATDRHPFAWVGTEGIERIALATGNPQFELLSPTTESNILHLRACGVEVDINVYAPAVIDSSKDRILDTLGEYVARRSEVRKALPANSSLDGSATGKTRRILLQAINNYALVGDVDAINQQITKLYEIGVSNVIIYPAGGSISPT
ncbi:MAG: luciferase [Halobacteriaceae archaeon]